MHFGFPSFLSTVDALTIASCYVILCLNQSKSERKQLSVGIISHCNHRLHGREYLQTIQVAKGCGSTAWYIPKFLATIASQQLG
jgi:hypothetical protein